MRQRGAQRLQRACETERALPSSAASTTFSRGVASHRSRPHPRNVDHRERLGGPHSTMRSSSSYGRAGAGTRRLRRTFRFALGLRFRVESRSSSEGISSSASALEACGIIHGRSKKLRCS